MLNVVPFPDGVANRAEGSLAIPLAKVEVKLWLLPYPLGHLFTLVDKPVEPFDDKLAGQYVRGVERD
jgi:hypothetical protein